MKPAVVIVTFMIKIYSMRATFHEWEYSLEEMDVNPILAIKPSKEIIYPTTLYKYYALNKNNLHAFLNCQLYASQPEQFNDMFDSNFLLTDFTKIPFDKIANIFIPLEKVIKAREYKEDPINFMYKFRNSTYSDWQERCGLSCFTSNQLNELMWAHYTSNSGFLVEYDFHQFPVNIKGPYPINYIETLSTIDASMINPALAIIVSNLIKKNIWQYEQEYRFILYPNDATFFTTTGRFPNVEDASKPKVQRLVKYPKTAIKKVLLGFNFFNHEKVSKEKPYTVQITSDYAINKCFFLDHLIENKFVIEIITWKNFKLVNRPMEIEKLDSTVYKIKIE